MGLFSSVKNPPKEYDLIVIGSGAGLNVASDAFNKGMNVAILEDGPLGGTCLNRGCIPTKIILYPAEVVSTLRDAGKIGVTAENVKVDFALVMKRMHDLVSKDVSQMTKGITSARGKGFDLYNGVGRFVDNKVLEVNGEHITAPTILIAAGSRETIPDITGLKGAGFLTSTSALELKAPPRSIIIMGGGYVAAEFAHFFDAVGTKVTIIGRNERFLPMEEPEISKEVKRRLSERMKVLTGTEVVKAGSEKEGKIVIAKDRKTGMETRYEAEALMVAVGRQSNADLFRPEKAGIKVDGKGWVIVDKYLRTNVAGIWAIGDAIGRNMFRHTANYESQVAWTNMNAASEKEMVPLDEHAVPHAVFTHPEVASVGLREADAVKSTLVIVGEANYTDAIRGYSMGDDGSFVKVVLDAKDRRILGAHAVGPHATAMVQPLVYLMNAGKGTYDPIVKAQTIHPAMEEIMVRAFGNLRPGKGQEKFFSHGHKHEHNHDHKAEDHKHEH